MISTRARREGDGETESKLGMSVEVEAVYPRRGIEGENFDGTCSDKIRMLRSHRSIQMNKTRLSPF